MLNKSKLKETKGERMYIHVDDDLTNEERKAQKKLREVAKEEIDRYWTKGENRIQEDTDTRGIVYMG
jgi:predicted metal-dependent hydrolase